MTTRRPETTTKTDDMSPDRPDYGTCPLCGYLMLPILELPPCGHDTDPQRAPLEAIGHIYAWTRTWHNQHHSTLIAMADLFNGRLRITAPVTNTETVEIGDPVSVGIGSETPYILITER